MDSSSGFDSRRLKAEQPAALKRSHSEDEGRVCISGPNRFLEDQIWTKSGAHKKDRGSFESKGREQRGRGGLLTSAGAPSAPWGCPPCSPSTT